MTPEELIDVACPKIGKLGSQFYFVPETVARGEPYGLDVFELYFLGRGGVLGDVEARVITSAFGYFKPQVVEVMWNSGREKIAPRDAGRLFLECCHDFGRAKYTGLDGLAEFCAAAEAVNAAADPVGFSLYAGISAEPLAEDLPARAQQLVTVLRELRGGAHLLSVLACGVPPLLAHYVRRPDFFALFGWSDEDVPVATAEDHAALDAADELTNRLMVPAFSVLDTAGQQALLAGLEAMEKALAS